jgi:chemotaxis signal transduction protein
MTAEAIETEIPSARPCVGLRLTLDSGTFSIALDRIHHLAGYATLSGEPDDYFLGWLDFRGQPVPVFDLNRVVCDRPSLPLMGTRILILRAPASAPAPFLGLLAAGVTDTVAPGDPAAPPLDLRGYLPMLYTLIPELPAP